MTALGGTRTPKGLRARVQGALAEWDLTARSIELITYKRKQGAGVWRVQTDQGPKSVKLSSRLLDRCRFMTDAIEHLSRRGARVPALHRTRNGEPFAVVGGQALVVTDWIDLRPAKRTLTGAEALAQGLGEFHHLAGHFTPSAQARFHTRLERWPAHYAATQRKAAQLKQRITGEQNPLLRSLVERLVRQADQAAGLLQRSPYATLAAEGERYWGLVHRDPSWTNLQLGPDGVWLVDLDSLVFDLPVSDLALFISETNDRRGRWDLSWVEGMLQSYQKAYELTPELYQLLLIELARPTLLCKRLRKLLNKSGTKVSEESLLKLLALDHTRCKTLAALGLSL